MMHKIHTLLLFPILIYSMIGVSPLHAQQTVINASESSPVIYKSVKGMLSITLEATEQKIDFGNGVIVDGAVYNGNYAGPILRVHPGDTMKIKLINHLTRPTNIHFHGLQVSPQGRSDNVHTSVKPGKIFDYEVKIPSFQTPGLYWYHDHTHGIAERNVMGGLTGPLIIEGFTDQFKELKNIKEQLFVLKNVEFDDDNKVPYVTKTLHNILQTINGYPLSTFEMKSGETQLWRFSNQSANLYFHLSLKGHKFRIIGTDGVAATKEIVTNTLDIMPATRIEALVDAGEAGTYDLISEKTLTGSDKERSLSRVLGKVVVSGPIEQSANVITNFPAKVDLRTQKLDQKRTIVFSQNKDASHYFVNGQTFDENRIDIRVPLGNTEEWTLRNDSDEFHEFHIHQVAFQITEINGKVEPFTGYVDNVRVPERGEVKIIIPFTNPLIVGQFVYHCHVLKHEDKGMMAQIEIYDPKKQGIGYLFRSLVNMCLGKSKKDDVIASDPRFFSFLPNAASPETARGTIAVGSHFSLTNQFGKMVSDSDFNGKYKLVFFGFTNCPDICPTTALTMSQIMEQLKGDAANLVPLFITVDPEQDTPAQLKLFLSSFNPAIIGLTGNSDQIRKIVLDYKVYSNKLENKEMPNGYSLDHSSYMYLMDKDGNFVTVFTVGTSPKDIAKKIQDYMAKTSH